MSITVYDPAGTSIAGKLAVVVAPAVANIAAPKVSEINAGTKIECALESFSPGTNVTKQPRRKLCDVVSSEKVGSRVRTLEPLRFTADSTSQAALLALFAEDATVFLIARPYVTHTTAVAASDKVWVFKCTVDALDPAAITTTDGEEFDWIVQLSVDSRNLSAVVSA